VLALAFFVNTILLPVVPAIGESLRDFRRFVSGFNRFYAYLPRITVVRALLPVAGACVLRVNPGAPEGLFQRGVGRLPLNVAADARLLIHHHRVPQQNAFHRRAQIRSGHRNCVAGTAIVKLPPVDQLAAGVE
jgi:hypothetical protein